jgi:hypothetical protein
MSSLKMAALLPNLTIVEQRTVIRFLWSECVKTSTFYRKILTQYGEKCMAKKNVQGAFKSLARPRRKQATASEDFDVHIPYLLS